MYCDTNEFLELPFWGPHPKPHAARGLSKHYHLRFDPKLGHDIFAIRRIPCACVGCASMLDIPWISGIPSNKKARYQPVTNFTYCPVLGSYNNWNIIELTAKYTPFEAFDELHKVVIDRINENMASLVQYGMYGAINTYKTTINGFYVIQFISDTYTLQNNTTIYGQVIYAGELFSNEQYICSTQENTNWYWKQQPLQHTIIVPKRRIIHSRIDAITIRDIQNIPKNVCNYI